MAAEQEGNYSDWNQNHAWSFQFHVLSWECRKCQESKDIIRWNDKVETLLVHCDAFLTKDEREKLNKLMNDIRTSINSCVQAPNEALSKKKGQIYLKLMEFETLMRRYVNSHFPFLKLKDNDDFSDL